MNKQLTKEECLEAFNHILHCDRDTCSNISDAYRNDLSTLHTLINEHFELLEWKKKFDQLEKLSPYEVSMLNVMVNAESTSKCNNCFLKLEAENPPLKFDELHDKMWVWDNKFEMYIEVMYVMSSADGVIKRVRLTRIGEVEFEENRFYRYEVD